MILTLIISVLGILGMMICIIKYPKIKIKNIEISTFFIPLLVVALILICFPMFDKENLKNIIFSDSKLNPVKILTLFISISFISITLDEAGFFAYTANYFINRFKKSQKTLFLSLYLLISVLTVFTSNDIVILTFTPFILHFSKKGNINPIPYLVMEFVAANTYSMLLPIGNPTNIYLTSIFDIHFLTYVSKMYIPTVLCGVSSFLILLLIFKKPLNEQITIFQEDNIKIKNKFLCIISLIHLMVCTIMLVISNYIHLEMWLIALISATSLIIFLSTYSLIKHQNEIIKPIKRIPYSLIPFILSMFVIIMSLESFNVFASIRNLIDQVNNETVKNIIYLTSSTISCNIFNNIPMTIAYGSILNGTTNVMNILSTVIGSNLGAILSPIGALAGIMWMRILKDNNIKYTFLDFIKYGSIITTVLLFASSISLLIV